MDLKKQEILLIQEKNAFEFINLGKFSEAEKTLRSLIKLDNKNYQVDLNDAIVGIFTRL